MKKVLFAVLVVALTSCGNSGAEANGDSTSVEIDTISNGTINTDTSGMGSMNMDTTGMSEAR